MVYISLAGGYCRSFCTFWYDIHSLVAAVVNVLFSQNIIHKDEHNRNADGESWARGAMAATTPATVNLFWFTRWRNLPD